MSFNDGSDAPNIGRLNISLLIFMRKDSFHSDIIPPPSNMR